MVVPRGSELPIHIPLTTRGRDRGGRYYWEVISQGKKVGGWGFSSVEDFRFSNWRLVPHPVVSYDGYIEIPNFW